MVQPKFNTSIIKCYPGSKAQLTFQKIEVDDTIILNIKTDGIIDTTFELPLNSQQAINILSNLSNFEDNEDHLGIEPIILVGDHNNLKIQVIASQIGKVFLKTLPEPKSVILSIGSRWFGKGDQTNDEDFDKLLFVLENVKELLSKK